VHRLRLRVLGILIAGCAVRGVCVAGGGFAFGARL
jgi:hypothetical protein